MKQRIVRLTKDTDNYLKFNILFKIKKNDPLKEMKNEK